MSELNVKKINLGTSSSSENPNVAIHIACDDNTSTIVLEENSNNNAAGDIKFWKTRDGAAPEDDDNLGLIFFYSDKGETNVATIFAKTEASGADSGGLRFRTKEHGGSITTRMAITDEGHVGIGTTEAFTPLTIKQTYNNAVGAITLLDSADSQDVWAIARGGTWLRFERSTGVSSPEDSDFTLVGYLDPASPADLISFTGQHRSDSSEELKDPSNIGLIVISTGVLNNLSSKHFPSINESLPVVGLSAVANDKRVFGVISNIEDPNTGTREHSSGNFISSYPAKDTRLIVNSLGEGAIWVTNINGDLENGDYISSCEIPGYGMKQDDDLLHNYTVAKITHDCTFDLGSQNYICEEIEHEGQTYKRAFVGCTYHCG